MRFKGLDLNLVVALDVLLRERSVSRAAERLGLSQPATSAALARLRDFFHDDLLVQHGKKMFPTPYADGLGPQLDQFLRSADALIATSAMFEPTRTERLFRIIASDYIVVSVLSPLMAQLAKEAPGLTFELVPPDQLSAAELANGKADLLVTPESFSTGDFTGELLFEERHMVIGCRDNPLFDGPLTEERMFGCGQVAVQLGAARQRTFADTELERLNKPRRIEVIAGTFTSVPWLLIGTTRVAVMHERLARQMVAALPIRAAPLPFPFPLMREMLLSHPVRASDEGLLWLRTRLRAHVAQDGIIHRTDRKRSG